MEDSVSAEVNTDSLEIDGKRITVSTLGDSAIHAAIVEAFGRTYEMGTEDIGELLHEHPQEHSQEHSQATPVGHLYRS